MMNQDLQYIPASCQVLVVSKRYTGHVGQDSRPTVGDLPLHRRDNCTTALLGYNESQIGSPKQQR